MNKLKYGGMKECPNGEKENMGLYRETKSRGESIITYGIVGECDGRIRRDIERVLGERRENVGFGIGGLSPPECSDRSTHPVISPLGKCSGNTSHLSSQPTTTPAQGNTYQGNTYQGNTYQGNIIQDQIEHHGNIWEKERERILMEKGYSQSMRRMAEQIVIGGERNIKENQNMNNIKDIKGNHNIKDIKNSDSAVVINGSAATHPDIEVRRNGIDIEIERDIGHKCILKTYDEREKSIHTRLFEEAKDRKQRKQIAIQDRYRQLQAKTNIPNSPNLPHRSRTLSTLGLLSRADNTNQNFNSNNINVNVHQSTPDTAPLLISNPPYISTKSRQIAEKKQLGYMGMLERFESLEQKRQKIIGSKSREVKAKELSQCSRKPTINAVSIALATRSRYKSKEKGGKGSALTPQRLRDLLKVVNAEQSKKEGDHIPSNSRVLNKFTPKSILNIFSDKIGEEEDISREIELPTYNVDTYRVLRELMDEADKSLCKNISGCGSNSEGEGSRSISPKEVKYLIGKKQERKISGSVDPHNTLQRRTEDIYIKDVEGWEAETYEHDERKVSKGAISRFLNPSRDELIREGTAEFTTGESILSSLHYTEESPPRSPVQVPIAVSKKVESTPGQEELRVLLAKECERGIIGGARAPMTPMTLNTLNALMQKRGPMKKAQYITKCSLTPKRVSRPLSYSHKREVSGGWEEEERCMKEIKEVLKPPYVSLFQKAGQAGLITPPFHPRYKSLGARGSIASIGTPQVSTPQHISTPQDISSPQDICRPQDICSPQDICTPQQASTPKQIRGGSRDKKSSDEGQRNRLLRVARESSAWLAKKRKKLEEERQKKAALEIEECTFEPHFATRTYYTNSHTGGSSTSTNMGGGGSGSGYLGIYNNNSINNKEKKKRSDIGGDVGVGGDVGGGDNNIVDMRIEVRGVRVNERRSPSINNMNGCKCPTPPQNPSSRSRMNTDHQYPSSNSPHSMPPHEIYTSQYPPPYPTSTLTQGEFLSFDHKLDHALYTAIYPQGNIPNQITHTNPHNLYYNNIPTPSPHNLSNGQNSMHSNHGNEQQTTLYNGPIHFDYSPN